MKENKFGVDAIKRLITRLSQVSSAFFFADTDEDGEISTTETIGFVGQLFPIILAVSSDWQNLTNEVIDVITRDEWDEIVLHVNNTSFIPTEVSKEHVENYIKSIVNWANYNRKFVEETIDFFAGDENDLIEDFDEVDLV